MIQISSELAVLQFTGQLLLGRLRRKWVCNSYLAYPVKWVDAEVGCKFLLPSKGGLVALYPQCIYD